MQDEPRSRIEGARVRRGRGARQELGFELLEARYLLNGDPPLAADDVYRVREDQALVIDNSFQESDRFIRVPGNELRDLAYDHVRDVLYVAARDRNRVYPIDLTTDEVGEGILVPGDPDELAITDNAQYMYVGADGASSVVRVDLATQQVESSFPISDKYVEDLATIPGQPESVIVSRSHRGLSPRTAGINIYDNGVKRGKGGGGNSVAVNDDGTVMYSFLSELSSYELNRYSITEAGLTRLSSGANDSGHGEVKWMNGRLFFDTGEVRDADTLRRIGSFRRDHHGEIVPMPSGRLAYLTDSNDTIVVYDENYLKVETIRIGGKPWAHHGLQMDEERVAFVDGRFVYIVRSDHFVGSSRRDIMVNDVDPEGDPLSLELVQTTQHGLLQLEPNGTFQYVPDRDFSGTDTFTYRVNDGTNNSTDATVSIEVMPMNDAPEGESDTYRLETRGPLFIQAENGVLKNDFDLEGDSLTAVVEASVRYGNLSLQDDGGFFYVPNDTFQVFDRFTYRVSDGMVLSDPIEVTITMTETERTPIALNDEYSVVEDGTLVVSENDGPDLPNDLIGVNFVSFGAEWSFLDDGSDQGQAWYQPAFDDSGWSRGAAELGYGDGDEATVVSFGESSSEKHLTTYFRHEFELGRSHQVMSLGLGLRRDDGAAVYLNGTEVARQNLPENAAYDTPASESAESDGNRVWRIDDLAPSLLVAGKNVIAVEVHQASGGSSDISFDLELAGEVARSYSVLGNDFSPVNALLTAELAQSSQNGSLSFNSDGTFEYVPDPDFSGVDQFYYRVTDGVETSQASRVNITVTPVNDSPVAVDDLNYKLEEDQMLLVPAPNGLLANDVDVDGDALTAVLLEEPENGQLQLNADGSFAYVPNADFFGTDQFKYRANDGNVNSITAVVELAVSAVEDVPTVLADRYVVSEDVPLVINDEEVLTVDVMPLGIGDLVQDPVTGQLLVTVRDPSHPFNNTLAYYDPMTRQFGTSIDIGTAPSKIALSADGSSVHVAVEDGRAVQYYNMASNFFGDKVRLPGSGDRAEYVTSFNPMPNLSDTVMVSMQYSDNVSPRTAGSFVIRGDQVLRDQFRDWGPDLLAVDYDTGDVYGYENETSSFTFWFMKIDERGLRTIEEFRWGQFLTGYDVFDIQVTDGLLFSNQGRILSLESRNQVAEFQGADFILVPEERRWYSLETTEENHVLRMYDLDTLELLSSQVIEGVSGNTFGLTRYGLNGLAFGTDQGQFVTVQSDQLFNVENRGVLRNDYDPDGDALRAILVDDVAHGELVLNPDGTFSYTPNTNYFGTDQFTYQTTDGTNVSDPVPVVFDVIEVNDVPVAGGDRFALGYDADVLVVSDEDGVLVNDVDEESEVLVARVVSEPAYGTVELRASGGFTYTPNELFDLEDSFQYVVSDGTSDSEPTAVLIELDVPRIDLGEIVLRPNTPGQMVPIYVDSQSMVSGANLFVQVGDGGPELAEFDLPEGTKGPAVTAVDLKTNTIFAAIEDNQIDQLGIPQVATTAIAISEEQQSVVASGLLATITVDTTGLFEGSWDLLLSNVLPFAAIGGPFDTDFAGIPAHVTNGRVTVEETEVVNRQLVYRNASAFEGDAAIAHDKQPLFPGEKASFKNYTSYQHGINQLIVDVFGLLAEPTIDDFSFRAGRTNDLSRWTDAPAPIEFVFRPGEGVDGSDRVMIAWEDGAVFDQWLEVSMRSSPVTGLVDSDVFYFGNAPGDTGDSEAHALVNATDVVATRDHKRGPFDPAAIDDPFDFNRDGLVNATDVVFARDHITSPFTTLPLIEPGPPQEALPAIAGERKAGERLAAEQFRQLEQRANKHREHRTASRSLTLVRTAVSEKQRDERDLQLLQIDAGATEGVDAAIALWRVGEERVVEDSERRAGVDRFIRGQGDEADLEMQVVLDGHLKPLELPWDWDTDVDPEEQDDRETFEDDLDSIQQERSWSRFVKRKRLW